MHFSDGVSQRNFQTDPRNTAFRLSRAMQLSHGVSFRLSLAMHFSKSRNAIFRRNLATLEDFRRSLAEQLLPDSLANVRFSQVRRFSLSEVVSQRYVQRHSQRQSNKLVRAARLLHQFHSHSACNLPFFLFLLSFFFLGLICCKMHVHLVKPFSAVRLRQPPCAGVRILPPCVGPSERPCPSGRCSGR